MTSETPIMSVMDAVLQNDFKQLKKSIPTSSPTQLQNAFFFAVEEGQVDVVKLLLPYVDPLHHHSHALLQAIFTEHLEMVTILLPVSNITHDFSEHLVESVKTGNTDIIKKLLPTANPRAEDSYALEIAIENRFKEGIELLLPYCYKDRKKIIRNLYSTQDADGIDLFQEHLDRYETQQQKERLTKQLQPIATTKKPTKRKL